MCRQERVEEETELKCHLEIVYYTLGGGPMHTAVGVDMAAQYIHGEGDVGLCCQGGVAEPSKHGSVGELDVVVAGLVDCW